jgi:anhydro-N-acetylmuramic acid kinase
LNKQIIEYKALGLMSGTSLDGLDLCNASFYLEKNKWTFKINNSTTYPYSSEWHDKLKNAQHLSGILLQKLHTDYGNYLGKTAKKFIELNKINPQIISSHGHTVFHEPQNQFTFQLGNGANIAAKSRIKTVCDFRSTDIALNGQGAPLVPIGDLILFNNYQACLNLGGFSNISIKKNELIAFDICPVNIVLNYLSNLLGLQYDKNGAIAKSGLFHQELFDELNNIEFYNNTPPKSLGREWLEQVFKPIVDKYDLDISTKLNTITRHIAKQIGNTIKFHKINTPILLTGGGTKNNFLTECLRAEDISLSIPNQELIDFKEALIFGFLGILRELEITNTLNSVTGAMKNNIGGCIYLP